MKSVFSVQTKIRNYDTVGEFLEEFPLCSSDFVLSSQSLYATYFQPLLSKEDRPAVYSKDDFGQGEPTDLMMDALRQTFQKHNSERIIAIGGGAVIDMAKLLVLEGDYSASSYFLREAQLQKCRTLIAIPTTCGAGSEVSSISIAELTSQKIKLGLADETLFPDEAILIPELLENLPYHVFATSSVDALIHAVESYLSPKASRGSSMFSVKAMEMILQGYLKILNEKQHHTSLVKTFLEASTFAGVAFANAGTGAVHALSYPVSGAFHVPHGEANSIFIVAVMKAYQRIGHGDKLISLQKEISRILDCQEAEAYDKMYEILSAILPLKSLRSYGMKEEDVETFAKAVSMTQTRLLSQSYVYFNKEQLADIYWSLM